MNSIYERIWLKDGSIISKDVKGIDGHDLCFVALLYARDQKTSDAQNILKMINEKQPDHSCSIILETKSLIHLFLREYNAAQAFAQDALEKQAGSMFSYWVLAQIEITNRKYASAGEHFKRILEFCPESGQSILDLVEVLALGKEYKTAQQYLETANSSTRKKLYSFFIALFKHWVPRLLWIVSIFVLVAISSYLFMVFYLLTTIFLLYIIFQWGYKKGDRLLFGYPVFILSINSIFFFILFCSLLENVIGK